MAKQTLNKLISISLIDGIREILYFPVWWYTRGFLKSLEKAWEYIIFFDLNLAFTLWLKNIFTPLYGQNDFAGRIISFFLRLVMIIIKGVALLILIILVIAIIILWLVFPLFVIYQIVINF